MMQAVSSLSSVALSLNCRRCITLDQESNSLTDVLFEPTGIVNFCVGLIFLPIRNLISGGDMLKEGRVFYIFVVVLSLSTFFLFRTYK